MKMAMLRSKEVSWFLCGVVAEQDEAKTPLSLASCRVSAARQLTQPRFFPCSVMHPSEIICYPNPFTPRGVFQALVSWSAARKKACKKD